MKLFRLGFQRKVLLERIITILHLRLDSRLATEEEKLAHDVLECIMAHTNPIFRPVYALDHKNWQTEKDIPKWILMDGIDNALKFFCNRVNRLDPSHPYVALLSELNEYFRVNKEE